MIYAIDVTKEDIDNGQRGQCNTCPIALAIKRATGAACFVDKFSVSIWRDGEPCAIRAVYTPLEVSTFVKSFDKGYAVRPFSFSAEFRA